MPGPPKLPSKERAEKKTEQVLRFAHTTGGLRREYVIWLDQITGRLDAEFRRLTGQPFTGTLSTLSDGTFGMDVLAGWIWVANRQAGKGSSYDELLDTIALSDEFEFLGDDEVDADPEMPAAT